MAAKRKSSQIAAPEVYSGAAETLADKIRSFLKEKDLVFFERPEHADQEPKERFILPFERLFTLEITVESNIIILFGIHSFLGIEEKSLNELSSSHSNQILKRNFQIIVGKYGFSENVGIILEYALPIEDGQLGRKQFLNTLFSLLTEAYIFRDWAENIYSSQEWPKIEDGILKKKKAIEE